VAYSFGLLDTDFGRELLPGLKAGLYGSSFRGRIEAVEVTDWQSGRRTTRNACPNRRCSGWRCSTSGRHQFRRTSAPRPVLARPITDCGRRAGGGKGCSKCCMRPAGVTDRARAIGGGTAQVAGRSAEG
jgi:hypothetical protein